MARPSLAENLLLFFSSPSTRVQVWRYVSDRTGVLAMSNMPIIWAFSMRNNVLIWITGWNYSTLNTFHRWVARIATIEAIIHSIGYTVFSFLGRPTPFATYFNQFYSNKASDSGKESYIASWSKRYWWMGAIVSSTALALDSLCKVRPEAKLMEGYYCNESRVLFFCLSNAQICLRRIPSASHDICFAIFNFDVVVRILFLHLDSTNKHPRNQSCSYFFRRVQRIHMAMRCCVVL